MTKKIGVTLFGLILGGIAISAIGENSKAKYQYLTEKARIEAEAKKNKKDETKENK